MFCQECTSISSEHETDRLQPRSAAFGPAGIGFDRVSKPFRKRASGTRRVGANETAHVQFQLDLEVSPTQIGDSTRVIAMNLP